MRFCRCTECGSPVYQSPEGAPFRAFYPRSFDGYVNGKCNKLPVDLMPTIHINYENRMYDFNDDLPKFLVWPGGVMCNNDGSLKEQVKVENET